MFLLCIFKGYSCKSAHCFHILSMEHYGGKIQALIYNRGSSQRRTAEGIGIPESTLSRWIDMNLPPLGGIVAICEYHGEPLSRFFSGSGDTLQNVTAEEADILHELRRIDPENRAALLDFVKRLK